MVFSIFFKRLTLLDLRTAWPVSKSRIQGSEIVNLRKMGFKFKNTNPFRYSLSYMNPNKVND
jgi:hypothetical protein